MPSPILFYEIALVRSLFAASLSCHARSISTQHRKDTFLSGLHHGTKLHKMADTAKKGREELTAVAYTAQREETIRKENRAYVLFDKYHVTPTLKSSTF